MLTTFKKLTIIIPAYNEAPTNHLILDKLQQVNLLNSIEKEIIIVNDFSTNNTQEAINNYIIYNPLLNIQLFEPKINRKQCFDKFPCTWFLNDSFELRGESIDKGFNSKIKDNL